MPSIKKEHMLYPASDFMPALPLSHYTGPRAGYAPHVKIEPQDLAPMPMHPDPYDHYKNSAAVSQPIYSQPYGHHSSQQSLPSFETMSAFARREERMALENARLQHRRQMSQAAAYQEQQHVDEKAVGGVSAKLDYEMEQMTDFVAEMAVGIIKPGLPTPPTFRKWVLQVLNATRLPSATILLSLSYLALRVRGLSAGGCFFSSERSLYQMLTVGLILGSKFLDDNTFQNKSWAEVSNIPVVELNRDERDWLSAFGHRLHHDPNAPLGYMAWEAKWISWKALACLNTLPNVPTDQGFQRNRSLRHSLTSSYVKEELSRHDSARTSRASITAYSSPPYSPYDSWYSQRSATNSSPSTAPHSSGPHTPEYYSWPSVDGYGARQAPYGFAPLTNTTPDVAAYQAPYNMPAYTQMSNMWNCHGAHCQCVNCRGSLMSARYGTLAAA